MDKTIKSAQPITSNGIYVRGVVVSNSAKVFQRKDGSGQTVIVTHEIALQPGVASMQRFLDPKKDLEVKVVGEDVTEYPKLKEFETVMIRAHRIQHDDRTGQLLIKSGDLLESA